MLHQSKAQIVNRKGLHARASAQFVRCAEGFDARVWVEKDDEKVGATSIMGLMMLGASLGHEITILAEGRQAEAAIAALTELVTNGFGEGVDL